MPVSGEGWVEAGAAPAPATRLRLTRCQLERHDHGRRGTPASQTAADRDYKGSPAFSPVDLDHDYALPMASGSGGPPPGHQVLGSGPRRVIIRPRALSLGPRQRAPDRWITLSHRAPQVRVQTPAVVTTPVPSPPRLPVVGPPPSPRAPTVRERLSAHRQAVGERSPPPIEGPQRVTRPGRHVATARVVAVAATPAAAAGVQTRSRSRSRTMARVEAPTGPHLTVRQLRDARIVDAGYLTRAHQHAHEAMRPLDCLNDYARYRRQAPRALDAVTELELWRQRFGGLARQLEESDGVLLTLAWPPRRALRITAPSMMDYDENRLDDLCCRFPGLGGARLRALGVVLGPGEGIFSDTGHPVLLLSASGAVYAHLPPRPPWEREEGQTDDGERLYLAAETLRVFARDGLARCDFVYSESGGAPLAVTPEEAEDPALRGLLRAVPTRRAAVRRALHAADGRAWHINGCPGMLKDRLFVVSSAAPSYAARELRDRFGPEWEIVGRVMRTLEDPVADAECFVVLRVGAEDAGVYAFLPDTGLLRRVAVGFDQFLRLGPRRLYFNFRLYSINVQPDSFEPPTFHVAPGAGFCLLPKELIILRARAPGSGSLSVAAATAATATVKRSELFWRHRVGAEDPTSSSTESSQSWDSDASSADELSVGAGTTASSATWRERLPRDGAADSWSSEEEDGE